MTILVDWAETQAPDFESVLSGVYRISKIMTKELGYVNPAALREAAGKGELLVARSVFAETGRVVGFCNFHVRRDGIATVYEIAVLPYYRHKGVARDMLGRVLTRANSIKLKCPVDNRSNQFYARIGENLGVERGKSRRLMVWAVTRESLAGTAP